MSRTDRFDNLVEGAEAMDEELEKLKTPWKVEWVHEGPARVVPHLFFNGVKVGMVIDLQIGTQDLTPTLTIKVLAPGLEFVSKKKP